MVLGKQNRFWYPSFPADTLWPMPPAPDAEQEWRDERGWREYAATNRERIVAIESNAARLDTEIHGLRDRQHELADSIGLVQVLAEQVRNIAADVSDLTRDMRTTTAHLARVVERPTAPLIVQLAALVVAVAAFVVAATH